MLTQQNGTSNEAKTLKTIFENQRDNKRDFVHLEVAAIHIESKYDIFLWMQYNIFGKIAKITFKVQENYLQCIEQCKQQDLE